MYWHLMVPLTKAMVVAHVYRAWPYRKTTLYRHLDGLFNQLEPHRHFVDAERLAHWRWFLGQQNGDEVDCVQVFMLLEDQSHKDWPNVHVAALEWIHDLVERSAGC